MLVSGYTGAYYRDSTQETGAKESWEDQKTLQSQQGLYNDTHTTHTTLLFVYISVICTSCTVVYSQNFLYTVLTYIQQTNTHAQEDDVRQYVIRRPLPLKEGKPQHYKAPKIQRLITPVRIQRKRHLLALKRKWGEKSRAEAAEYARLLARRAKDARDQRAAKRRLSSKKSSTSSM